MLRAICFFCVSVFAVAQSGDWVFTDTTFGSAQYARMELKFEGEKISGQFGNLAVAGTLRNGRVEIETRQANGTVLTKRTGTLSGGEMKGEATRDSTPF